ncbi:MAG TPA: glycosyltransferase family 39 protein [Bryobacteraceae bacterium]|nr:glycosyltransferase family 39 protein [Bryobacteraceae bacterium]
MNRLLLAIPLAFVLYFFGLTRAGLIGPDEPRYASIARDMARTGDWVTPRLWSVPWFEKPPLLYWLEAAAFRLGINPDLAPRLPIALLSIVFLVFFYWILRREFGDPAASYSTAILGTSAAWLAYSHIGVTDLPLTATFSAAMLLSLGWIERGDRRYLPLAAALLGLAVLAKGLVPLALAAPLLWMGRRRLLDWLRPAVILAFAAVALPWYLLCYLRNGAPFLHEIVWTQQIGRFFTAERAHTQPFWFYVPILIAALFPWFPALAALARRELYSDTRRRFLLAWAIFGFVFFSAARNKLPGYALPLIPPIAILAGLALADAKRHRAITIATAALLVFLGPIASILPAALAGGISRSTLPPFEWTWLLPALAILPVWLLERSGSRGAAITLIVISITAATVAIKLRTFPEIDRLASARPLWSAVVPIRDRVCVASLHRSLRYGLNYYSVTPLPDCRESPREIEIRQNPGEPPRLVSAVAVPASNHKKLY